ncbi:class I SAM-dependent methyltransferase [Arthrobacter sp. JSM 101049]|uniref:class I SAM-dependent methyltransferase n=1 Tax=Arthrobacter sp. JSM 101049 TaxID=929097 RepID=UPI003563B440
MSERIEDTMDHHHTHHDGDAGSPADAQAFWDARYGERERIWSGAANRALVDVVTGVQPGSALDLGCGEGGDSLWLAETGWMVTGVDISETALARAREESAARGMGEDEVEWIQVDLARDFPAGTYDLVSACFLASQIPLPRTEILRRAVAAVAPGGMLVLVSHASAPPWAGNHHHGPRDFPTPEEELAALDLDADMWEITTAETRKREANGPDGERATLEDTVVVVQRR